MGYAFLTAYIILVGVATFLQKFVMKQLSPYQLEVLIAIGMLIISVPVLFIQQKSLAVPLKGIPLGALVGLGFALGSFVYVLAVSKMSVSIASAISTSYVVVVVILSTIFLKESLSILKLVGIVLTVL